MKQFIFAIFLASLLSACDGSSTSTDNIAQHQGKWVFINYWATWCKPCIEEIPELNEFAKQNPALVVLGVNYDGIQGDELKAAEEKLTIEFATLAHDPYQELGYDRPSVLPVTMVINPEGKAVKALVGPQTFGTLMAAYTQ